MAEIPLVTSTPLNSDRSYGVGAAQRDNLAFVANTSAAYEWVTAPYAGVLSAVYVSADVTSDATKTYTIVCTNETNSDAAMIGTTLYDADPVLTAGTPLQAVLSATAANLVVALGDVIKVGMTGGTGSGNAGVILVWESVS
jgi:hypothetical protein